MEGDTSAPVKASDITVLVRSRQEAALIRDALTSLNIPSVYLSNRDSVFETLEAQEMLWVLQAVLAPERESTLRSALASSMLGLNARDIDALNCDEAAWDAVVEEFVQYRERWQKRGVMAMLRELMRQRHIAENMLATAGGERRLTDILHISELLQEAGTQLESEHALVRWLAQQIADPNSNSSSQQMRLESDKHLVQIVTIHKSKGLEYPLVWLPLSPIIGCRIRLLSRSRVVRRGARSQQSRVQRRTGRGRAPGGRFTLALCGPDPLGLALQSGYRSAIPPPWRKGRRDRFSSERAGQADSAW